jgi:putative two-component system response regulator
MSTRVLVIDDDAQSRQLVAAVLAGQGYEVAEAPSGVIALALADANLPALILLDVTMPGMDGYEVCRVLRQGERTKGVPVVMLTVSGDIALNRKAYEAGAQACVPKPFRREGLVATIQAVLTGTHLKKPAAG